MFKKVMTTWAKEMDKERYKEQDKRKKREYYTNICVKHSELINEVVSHCENFIFDDNNQISHDTPSTVAVHLIEDGLSIIEQTIKVIKDNKTPYDLPSNAKQAYNDCMQALLNGFEFLQTGWKTRLLLYQALTLFEIGEISESEFRDVQDTVSSVPDLSEIIDEYVYYRKLQVEKYKTTLEIIGSH